MNFFDSKENRRIVFAWLSIGLLFEFLAMRYSIAAGSLVFLLIIIYSIIFFKNLIERHKKISSLIESIDKILHNDELQLLDSMEEGEFAMLETEIRKMTVRIREHDSKITKEKVYLSDSISDISHQLRTPLTSVNMLVSFLRSPDIDEDRKRKYLMEITRHLDRLDWLISALLKISKMDAGTINFQKNKVVVGDTVAKAVEPIMVSLEIREQLLDFASGGRESFVGDINWTVEALSNIIKNCMEHTQIGGAIHIKTRENALFTEITIKDNGPGIAEDDLPYIFQRFYKGKNSVDSSVGIGLALSRMIIEKQNGTIKVQNHKDGGALFTIRLYKEGA